MRRRSLFSLHSTLLKHSSSHLGRPDLVLNVEAYIAAISLGKSGKILIETRLGGISEFIDLEAIGDTFS